MSVHDKLLKIQSSINVPKSQYNTFGKYNYRSCEDILSALKPFLAEVKCTVIVNDDLVMIGNRYYIKSTAKLVDCETGEEVSNTSYARECSLGNSKPSFFKASTFPQIMFSPLFFTIIL